MSGKEKFMGVYLNEDLIMDFHLLALKEGQKLKELHKKVILDYIKKHGDGNPAFTLDQFTVPNFIACPAFFRDIRYWNYYFSKQTPEELDKFKHQIIQIDKIMARYL